MATEDYFQDSKMNILRTESAKFGQNSSKIENEKFNKIGQNLKNLENFLLKLKRKNLRGVKFNKCIFSNENPTNNEENQNHQNSQFVSKQLKICFKTLSRLKRVKILEFYDCHLSLDKSPLLSILKKYIFPYWTHLHVLSFKSITNFLSSNGQNSSELSLKALLDVLPKSVKTLGLNSVNFSMNQFKSMVEFLHLKNFDHLELINLAEDTNAPSVRCLNNFSPEDRSLVQRVWCKRNMHYLGNMELDLGPEISKIAFENIGKEEIDRILQIDEI